jgi:uncharacterized protein YdaU (DUF1376 family)
MAEQKVYMPLMVGDWIKGTRGMRAEVKGVYLGLLLHQFDHGFIPADIYELELIEPEINKVWVKLKDKFVEIEPGKLQNKKLEEVKEFWKKQKQNGKKGGRPKNENPKRNPNNNPEPNPKGNLNNDLDNDSDTNGFNYELKVSEKKVESLEIVFEEVDEKLQAFMDWTEQAVSGNDHILASMLRPYQSKIKGNFEALARDHLEIAGRYKWHQKADTQHAFRFSLVNFIKENHNKANGKTQGSHGTASAKQVSGTNYDGDRRNQTAAVDF